MFLTRIGNKSNTIIYIDGSATIEKIETHQRREERRQVSLAKAQYGVRMLEDRLSQDQRVRRHHFTATKKHLKTAFRWSVDARSSFASYMSTKGWRVVRCRGEADVDIAMACSPTDTVLSRDSDYFAYQSVLHIWRPTGYGTRLTLSCYHVPDILMALSLTRSQLTAICVVTSNDYNKNLPTLGIASNYALIKNIEGGMNQVFLATRHVLLKALSGCCLLFFSSRVFILFFLLLKNRCRNHRRQLPPARKCQAQE